MEKFIEEFEEFMDIEMLMDMLKDLGSLDSDVLLDFVADIIIRKIRYMDWRKLKEYFGFEEEFLDSEREMIEKNILDFFLSIDFEGMKFPFSSKTCFSNLKNKFFIPMNILLARIIERSDHNVAFALSLINKTLKNENDRYPIKPERFRGSNYWTLRIHSTNFKILPEKKIAKNILIA
uniref:Uncharacterized protein n=1 Tax=Panagrolaimus sp. ES5 TaxID=591445 RepID=A0AC34FX41_9BILA